MTIPLPSQVDVTEFACTLPGISECVFQSGAMSGHLAEIVWVGVLLYCKLNFSLTFKEFYEKIKVHVEELKKVHISERYA
jgi:hypothetical protein